MSDATIALVAVAVTQLATIAIMILNRLKAADDAKKAQAGVSQANENAVSAARRVDEVKDTLLDSRDATNKKLDGMAKVNAATHTLVNNAMSIQLRYNALLARQVADLTIGQGKAEAMRAATAAENALDEHLRKQSIVDARDAEDAK